MEKAVEKALFASVRISKLMQQRLLCHNLGQPSLLKSGGISSPVFGVRALGGTSVVHPDGAFARRHFELLA